MNNKLSIRLVNVKNEIERVGKLMAFVLPSDKLQKRADRIASKNEAET